MKILKIISVVIFLMMVFRFIALLSLFVPVFEFLVYVGAYIPGFILGFVGFVLNIVLREKTYDTIYWERFYIISANFCLFIALADIAILYAFSQI